MKIVFVKPTSKFAIEVGFEDGKCGVVNLGDLAGRGVFRAWLEEGVFEKVKVTDLRPPTSDLRPPTSDLRPPTSDLRPPTSDLRSPFSVLRSPFSDL
jgi:hypothetical protein